MPVTFVVLNTTGPQLASSAGTTVLTTAGSLSGPGSVLLSPGATVSISLNSSTFINTNANTQYYAVCSDNSPLPSWLIFDPSALSFSGITLAASSPSQLPEIYVLHVIATDVPGFSSAAFQFRLTIDLHYLEFGSERIVINITDGQAFNYTGLKNNLTLDGEAIDISLITNVQAESSSWLLVDNTTLDISGTPPQDFHAQSFWVYIQDTYGDEANTTVFLSANASTPLLAFNIPSLNLSCGETVSYTIPTDAFVVDNVDTSVDLGNCSSWLSYNPQNLTFTGKVPESWLPQVYYFNLTVSKGLQSVSEEITITIRKSNAPRPVSPPNGPVFPPSNTTDGTPTSTATSGNLPTKDANYNRNVIIIAVIVSLFSAAGIVALIFWWRKKKDRPLDLTNTETHRSKEAERLSQFQLRSPSSSPLGFGDDWYGRSPPKLSDVPDGRDKKGHRKSYAKRPDSAVLGLAARKTKSKKRRAALLASARNIGFGHGGIALQDLSTAPSQRPKHIPIRIPSQAHLMVNDSNEHLTSPNDSYETIESSSKPVQPSTVLGHNTIRQVAKSPTPSEMPSPDLNSSPRAKLRSFVHDRATGRKTSGLFSSTSTQRVAEQGLIVPGQTSRKASFNINGNNPRTVSASQYPARHSSQRIGNSVSSAAGKPARATSKALASSRLEDPFYAAPLSSSKPVTQKPDSAKGSVYSTDDDEEWTDDTDEKAVPLVWHTGSSQALSVLASPSAIIDPARVVVTRRHHRVTTPVKNNAILSDDSPLEYSANSRPARLRAPRQRPVSIEHASTVLARENLTNKSLRGDIAFP